MGGEVAVVGTFRSLTADLSDAATHFFREVLKSARSVSSLKMKEGLGFLRTRSAVKLAVGKHSLYSLEIVG